MDAFPRTTVGGVSMPRMIIGTNWFFGYSHTTHAKDILIRNSFPDHCVLADILEVFVNAGVDAIMGMGQGELLQLALKETEQRTGKRIILVSTPTLPFTARTPFDGFDMDAVNRILDRELACRSAFVMPHTSTTDVMVDSCTREIRKMDAVCAAIRERGMVPGLSTHLPQSIVFADESGLDVETYISIYNAMGFLMPIEVDWTHQTIMAAKKPVMTIKPMAAGHIRPFQALTFVWNTLRPQDMVTVGTLTPDEAKEVIEISLGALESRRASVTLQETRSKSVVKAK